MKIPQKYLFLLGAVGLVILFFFTRFYNILGLPIFTDEAIYIHWSQVAANDASWRFISLTDGKQPMFVWVAMILLKLIHNPLIAGRAVSVIAGFLSTIGIYFLASEVFKNKKVGLVASLLYILYPFSLVYDRLALYDSLVAMFIIWSLYFEFLLIRHIRLDLAMILGMVVGAGMLTKTNADFALILLPFSLLLFNFKEKNWRKEFWKWILFAFVAVVIANVMYSVLRLSPFYYIIAQKTLTFLYSPRELLMHPFAYLFGNLHALIGWFITYTTLPGLILILASFVINKKFWKERVLLAIWFVVPLVGLALFGKVIYPRFLLPMAVPLLVLAADSLYSLVKLSRNYGVKILVVVVFLTMFVANDFYIVTDFSKATVADADRGMLLAAWPSGVGVNETVAFLEEKSKHGKIYIGTEGTFGLMPYALQIFLYNNPNVISNGFWPINDTPPHEVITASKTMPTYFVFYQPCPSCQKIGIVPPTWHVKQVFQIKKLENDTYYSLYQVLP